MDIRHLIEALRGGNDPNGGVVSARRYPNGEVLKYPYGRNPPQQQGMADQLRKMMPVGLRKQQLHNQEVQAGSQDSDDKDY